MRRQKTAGSRKIPTETPTDGTKIGAEVVKPLLKNRSVFEKPRSVLWTTGRGFENPEAVVLKPRMRKWNSKTPSRCLEKSPVGGFKTILKRASGDCVEGSETQAWSTAQGRRQGVKERQEGIASNKAEQSQVWQRRQAAEVCKQQGNCLEASAEVYNRRQWSTVETAPTENTSVHGHDSYLGSSLGEKRCLQGTRLPSYRKTCKKGSP